MIRNAHERLIDAPAEQVGLLMDRLGGPEDPIWPPAWTPMRLDRPLQGGADGGHGSVRYTVTEHVPGRRVRFTFRPEAGIEGFHEFEIVPLGEHRCRVRHVMIGRALGSMRVLAPAVVVLHDALLEDLLDRVERLATGAVRTPAVWSPATRLWHRLIERRELRQDAKQYGIGTVSEAAAAVR